MNQNASLFRLLLRKKRLVVIFAVAVALLSVVAPFKSYIMQWLIDAGSKAQALRSMGLGILVIVASHGFEYICRDAFSRAATSAVAEARLTVMERISQRSMRKYLSSTTGDIQSCLTNDMRLIFDDYYMGLFNICMWGGMGLAALIMLAVISPLLMVMATLLCLLPLVIPKVMAKPLSRARADYSKDTAAYTGHVGELIKGFEALFTSGGLNYFRKSHAERAEKNREYDYKMRLTSNRAAIFTSLGAWLPSVLVLLAGVFLVFEGKITIGYLVTANSLTNFVISPFRMVSNSFVGVKASAAIRKRVEDLMNEETDRQDGEEIAAAGDIALKDVVYRYPGAGRNALHGVTLSVKRGEKVALVGPSGSGKSTIAKLLYRYDEAEKGDISSDGVPLNRIRLDSWYSHVSMIPQTPFLFTDTLKQNICLYHEYTASQIESAIARAGLSEFVASLPEELETRITEGGRNLSGGQMQRIAIARALLRGSDLILVDEATSSLDIATTCAIMNNLISLDCTVILITHDLYGEAMSRLDRIFYLEDGSIRETGTLSQLLASDQGFACLFRQMEIKPEAN